MLVCVYNNARTTQIFILNKIIGIWPINKIIIINQKLMRINKSIIHSRISGRLAAVGSLNYINYLFINLFIMMWPIDIHIIMR